MTPPVDATEPFLQAIFARPDDLFLRRVFADYLDDADQPDWAWLTRAACEPGADPETLLADAEFCERLNREPRAGPHGGFRAPEPVALPAHAFRDAADFRRLALTRHPHWYGARQLRVTDGRIADPAPLRTILTSPVTAHVTDLVLRGEVSEAPADDSATDGTAVFELYNIVQRPVIAGRMVEVLAQTREARRLTTLDLRNNDLDNDALRSLSRSPYLSQLTTLKLTEGNLFKGRHWQAILEAYGEDVVQ